MSSNKVFICSHQIYLNENQRYDLFACVPVKTTGVYIQAEISKNYNSKEIKEIFCNYEIDCKKSKKPIEVKRGTIKIHLPVEQDYLDFLGEDQKIDSKNSVCELDDLLNLDEGGKEEIFYETISHVLKHKIKSYHKIEVKDIKKFEQTVEFVSFNN